MAIQARKYSGEPLSGWLNVTGETYAAITDVTNPLPMLGMKVVYNG